MAGVITQIASIVIVVSLAITCVCLAIFLIKLLIDIFKDNGIF